MNQNILLKKTFSMLFAFILVFSLFSCEIFNNKDGSEDENQNTEKPESNVNQNAVWGSGIRTKIVIKEGSELDLYELAYDIYYYTDNRTINVTDAAENSGHEIAFGETNRPVSAKAYEKLYDFVDIKSEDGFLIFADGNSLAVAYTSETALENSIKHITENYLSRSELVFEEKGVVASGKYNLREAADAAREAARTEAFDRIEKELGAQTRAELERLFTLYTPRVYEWLAGLYSAETGGFYYSNSGRDNEGFLPDVESTYQALVHLTNGGMFVDKGGYQYALSEKMKAKLLSFVKGLQSPEDGYFYHPQWGYKNEAVSANYRDARRGRDLSWATYILRALGEKPYYNTPGGMMGELGAPGASVSLTSRLSVSRTFAVSKVTSVNSILPAQLQSMDAWREYIASLDIPNDPYMAGNTLAAQHNEISLAGDEYIKYLTDYLTDIQNKETGFWGNIKDDYEAMSGFMKLSHCYTYFGIEIPNSEKALENTIRILLTPDTDSRDLHICNTYNTWANFTQILLSAEKCGDTELVNRLRAKIIEKAPELIKITYEKTLTHKRDDGGFSYFETKPCNHSQMAPVGCSSAPEGDVNATALSVTGMAHSIFQALGIKSIPIYVPEDADVFFRIIEYS